MTLKAKGMSGWMYQVNDKKGAVGGRPNMPSSIGRSPSYLVVQWKLLINQYQDGQDLP